MLDLIPKIFAQASPPNSFNFQQIIKESNPGNVFVGTTGNTGVEDFTKLAADTAKVALETIVVLCIGVLVLAGYKYVTALGDEERSKKAKTSIAWAIIGLLIAIFSYSIVNVILNLSVLKP